MWGKTQRYRHGALRALVALTAAGGIALAAACSPSHPSLQPLPSGAASAVAGTEPLTLTPAAGGQSLPVSTEVGFELSGAMVTEVTLAKAGSSDRVEGAMREDGSSWVPAAPLSFATAYTATVTARSADGARTEIATTSFTTMAKPARETGTGLYLFNGKTVGVAMPVAVEFSPPVPEQARAQVQKRLFVTSIPPQPGVWHWASGSQVWYRPPLYWQPGTTISVRAALGGLPMGGGFYGDTDRSATVKVGPKVFLDVDNATKQMTVFADDKPVRTIPVSLGKPSTPSSSGHMVVMSADYQYRFDTRGEPNGGYVVDVNYAMRLTWGGEFIHAAPWSVGDQGVRNVSHGCVNMSWDNAEWIFGVAHIGDPVIVRGTEVQLENGNGWTAWNIPWPQYVKGSALPVPADLMAAAGIDPATGTAPEPAVPTPSGAADGVGSTPSPSADPSPTA